MTRAWVTATVSCAVALIVCNASVAWGKAAPASSKAKASTSSTKAAAKADAKPRPTMTLVYRAAERVRRATLEVINDVAQRPLAVMEDDPRDFIPTYSQVEKDPTVWKKELNDMGALEPPKKSWLDSDMGSLQRAIDLVNNEVEALPADEQTGQSWTDLSAAVSKMNASMKDLTPLCVGPKYENLKIAAAALNVRDAAKTIIAVTRADKR